MSERWPVVRLGDHVNITTGYPFKSAQYTGDPAGIRLLRGDNVAQGWARWEGVKRWPAALTDGLENYALQNGDVCIAMDRPWIEAGLKFAAIKPSDLPALLVQRVARLRARNGLTQQYLAAIIAGKSFTAHIRGVQTGTAVPHVSADQIRAFKFRIPPLSEQQAVAETLAAFERKFDSNQRLAEACDRLLHTVLESQFKASDAVVPLSDLARFVNGKPLTKGASGTGRMVIRIAELNNGPGGSTVYSDATVADDHVARAGDLLFSWSGTLMVRRWHRAEAVVNQHIFKVLPNPGVPIWLVYGHLHSLLPGYRRIARNKATTMGHIQRHHLDVPIPAIRLADRLHEVCESLWRRAIAAEVECVSLKRLKSGLAEQLLTGAANVDTNPPLAAAVG